MPTVDAVVETPVHDSFRVKQVSGMFDLPVEKRSQLSFSAEVPDLEESWTIGAIVGPSGSGKSTIARAAFGDQSVMQQFDWPRDAAVVD